MATVALDVEAARARFSALQHPVAYFDGPGGTQVPDEVIDAIAMYLRDATANVGGAFAASIATETLVADARARAGHFLGCSADEVVFGPNMTSLSFTLSRTLGRELRPGDEIVTTRLDHDANVAPWLELARDLDLVVRFADLREDTTVDLDHLAGLLTERTRVVAFPVAANSTGALTDAGRVAALAHEAGALAWADAVHYAPHGPIDVGAWDLDVLLCSPYKYFGPHLGLAFARRELLERWRPYKVRPAPESPPGHRFETGTLPHELLAGFSAAVDYLDSLGWDALVAHETALGARFLEGLPANCTLYGPPTMEGRVPTFALTAAGRAPADVAQHLAERGYAVWSGNYYALEVMAHLGLPDGAVRVGIVHYNTADEVDGLLGALADA